VGQHKSFRSKQLIETLYHHNDGTRALLDSIIVPEVADSLQNWSNSFNSGAIIGGIATSYHGKPRVSMEIDLLVQNMNDVHHSNHAYIKLHDPESINLNPILAKEVIDSAIESDGVKIASPSGIVALKLQRLKRHDIGDIVDMIETGKVDLTGFTLSKKNIEDFEEIKTRFV